MKITISVLRRLSDLTTMERVLHSLVVSTTSLTGLKRPRVFAADGLILRSERVRGRVAPVLALTEN